MTQETISIIIPIYNAGEYLVQCLQSIEQQTHKNLEILCIDDGSKDSSLSIAQSFSERDSRFVVLTKENGGQSSARNMGLDHATGKFVMFVDSDDWIEPDTAEGALRAILEEQADCVMWTYMREYGKNSKKKIVFDRDRTFDCDQCKDLHRQILGLYREDLKHPENADALAPVWTKLFKREIIQSHHLRFIDIHEFSLWEDGLFSLQYFEHVQKAVFIDAAWYHYRKISGGTNVSKHRPELLKCWEKRQQLLGKYIQEHDYDDTYQEALRNRNALNLISLSLNAAALPKYKAYTTIRRILHDNQYSADVQALKVTYLPWKWKIFYLFCRFRFASGVTLLALYMRWAIMSGNPT